MTEEIKLNEITAETCYVSGTHTKKGRFISVTPENTASRFLSYGQIRLEAGDEAVKFNTQIHETGFVCLKGKAEILVESQPFQLSPYDSLYVPRETEIIVQTKEFCDVAEISAPVERRNPVQFVSFQEVKKDASLHFIAGKPPSERDLNILLGKNVEAGRIMAGVTFSSDGNWTSFPPHEHQQMLEEAYLYIDMPAPQWGIQMVYTDLNQPELVQVVREGDAVLMPKGFHPNVAAPGGSINFLWMMAAHREGIDRQFGVVNVHPDYARGGSGLEASHK